MVVPLKIKHNQYFCVKRTIAKVYRILTSRIILIIIITVIIKIRPKCKKSTELSTESKSKSNFLKFFKNYNIGNIAFIFDSKISMDA